MRDRSHLLPLAALVLSVTVAACSSDTSTTTSTHPPLVDESTTTSTSSTSTSSTSVPEDKKVVNPGTLGEPEKQSIWVMVDGWSVVAAGTDIQVRVGDSWETVTLKPLSASEVANVRRSYPDMLAAVAGRLVNTDHGWTCDEEGCSTLAGTVEDIDEMLADPSKIPGYGKVYEAWGVEAGLYGAKVDVLKGAQTVELATEDGFRSRNLVGDESHVRIHGLDTNNPVAFASAGLGVFFEPFPLWAISEEGYSYLRPQVAGEVDVEEAKKLDGAFPAGLYRGLSDTSAADALAGLSNGELTYMTSLVTGCGTNVVCAPTVDVDFETVAAQTAEGCVASAWAKEGEDPGSVWVALSDDRLRVTYPHPTVQAGVWGGSSVEDFEGHDPEVRTWGIPPTVEGTVQLRMVSVRIYTFLPGWGTQMTTTNGFTSETLEGGQEWTLDNLEDATVGYVESCG